LNVALNAVLIFVFDLGVVGAALGTVAGSIVSLGLFGWGLRRGRLPFIGPLPIVVSGRAPRWSAADAWHLLRISSPLVLRKMAQNGAQFPMLAIVGLFGADVVAAYVVALRVRALMNTPGWGFGLASSSLVGQALGRKDDAAARTYARETFRFTVAAFASVAVVVFAAASPIGHLFVEQGGALDATVALIRAACVSVVLWGVMSGGMGPLRASGDTQWPFYGQILGLFAFALPAAYLGTVTDLGLWGLHLSLVLETGVPAAVIFYRYASHEWVRIGRAHRSATVGV
jgi:Na+-driven multidrug efflux pump